MGYLGTHTFGQGAAGHFGAAGGFGGTGLPAPVGADILKATTVDDVRGAQQGATDSLAGQQGLLAALQKQGGLQAQNQALAGLQGTAGMYQNIASGQGPNPAQAMLNQATGQNVANQAALMASQRGAGANVGLMARQAAQQGAATQQQAVGQGATMQAQQQINALSGLAGVQGQQAGVANTMAGQQINQANAIAQSNLANQQAMQGSIAGLNQANVANQGNVLGANTSLQNSYISSQQKGLSKTADSMGGMSNAGGASMAAAHGGEVGLAGGGNVYSESNPYVSSAPPVVNGPQSSFGQFMSAPPEPDEPSHVANYSKNWAGKEQTQQTGSGGSNAWAGEDTGAGDGTMMSANGGLAQSGGHVNAKAISQRAVKSGDSYANDKIPAKLSEGEIVLPRSVTMSGDPINDSARFVSQVLAKRKVKK